MASININGTRKIQLLSQKKNLNAPHIKIGNYYGELTTDKSKTNGNPTLCFTKGGLSII